MTGTSSYLARVATAMAVAAMLLLAPPALVAQRATISVDAGLAFPVGDFGSERGPDAGFAGRGFGVGAEVALPLPWSERLAWTTSGRATFFSVDDDFTLPGPQHDIRADRYRVIPLVTGLRLNSRVLEGVNAHLAARFGVGWVRGPDAEVHALADPTGGSDWEYVADLEFDWVATPAMSFGAGVTHPRGFEVELRYFDLGRPELRGESRWHLTGHTGEFVQEQSVSWVQLDLKWLVRR